MEAGRDGGAASCWRSHDAAAASRARFAAARLGRALCARAVLQALAVVVPLGLTGAVSPVTLTDETVLLAGPGGRRAGFHYATAVVLTLVVVVAATMLFGRSIRLPTRPHLDASLDIVLGVVLLAVAGTLRAVDRRRATGPERAGSSRERASRRPKAAFPAGVFSMATNVTTLALLVPAAKEVSTAHTGAAGRVVLVLVLVSLASAPATVPVAVTRIAPGAGQRALAAVGELLTARTTEPVGPLRARRPPGSACAAPMLTTTGNLSRGEVQQLRDATSPSGACSSQEEAAVGRSALVPSRLARRAMSCDRGDDDVQARSDTGVLTSDFRPANPKGGWLSQAFGGSRGILAQQRPVQTSIT